MTDLTGKTVVVTGGNSGIGAAIVDAAAAAGANVVIDYVTQPEVADQMEKQLDSAAGHNNALAVEADVSQVGDLQKLCDAAVKEFGRIDVWINNAGIETRQTVIDTSEADFDRVIAINLKSAFFGTQVAAKQFISQNGGGVVINVTSVHEDWPMPGNSAYCVSKGGMRMLTRNAACELGPQGIRVVGIGPGAVATPINQSTLDDPTKLKALDAAIPLGRMAQPDEIAKAVVFLASDDAAYVTATTVFVDGGIMMGSLGL
ncbi:MAG: glucose 1-dehydrogenase [Nostocoides sp.]